MSSIQSLEDVFRVRNDYDRLHPPQCPVEKRQQEKREAEAREEREAQRRREEQLQSAKSWHDWAIAIADERIHAAMSLDGMICDPVGAVIGKKSALVRNVLTAEIKALRDELNAAMSKLREEFRVGIGRLPIAKAWNPDEVCYRGDCVVTRDGVFQALQDTPKPPAADHPHRILLARSGRDGCDGRTPNIRGTFDAREKYVELDIVTCHGDSYIACRDDPGLPGHDDDAWQLLARGSRGPVGEIGPRGRKGERGPRGESSPTIVAWTLVNEFTSHCDRNNV